MESETEKAAYVCAIGASAGGLRPLEEFFDAAKPGLNVGYVVIQHLSPDHDTMMETLLSRHTSMPVRQAIDGTQIQGDHIYLIPPNTEMSVFGGRLRLRDRPQRGPSPRPITIFFQSLASDYGDKSIAIVVSGTGSDGADGIVSVHHAGGLTLAQDSSAEFAGMPDRAGGTGEVDARLSPREMSATIDAFVRSGARPSAVANSSGLTTDEQIMMLLTADTGVDFSKYKSSTIQRRIHRRVSMSSSPDIDHYAELLHRDKSERIALFDDLLIDVSGFFRDAEMYETVEQKVMPAVIESALNNDTGVRIWSAACATGEEAYSMAMLAIEAADRAGAGDLPIQVFATDVNTNALAKATKGIYEAREVAGLSEERLNRHFRPDASGFRVNPSVRSHVTFTRHNLLTDPPFTRIDLAMCRNFLIYLRSNAQEVALSTVLTGVRSDGFIVLGASEDMGSLSPDVAELDRLWRVYRKTGSDALRSKRLVPYRSTIAPRSALGLARPAVTPDQRLLRAYDAILNGHFVGGILVNEQRELVHTFGTASEWMSPPTGRPSLDIFQLIDDPALRMAISATVRALKEDPTDVTARPVIINSSKGSINSSLVGQRLNVGNVIYHLVYATPVESAVETRELLPDPVATADVDQFERLESDLAYARESLQAAIEEQETSNEELSATNEELIASNEELQSTNEELSSVNEELRTLNDENQRQLEEVQELSADLDQLLSETEVGVIFLDEELHVRRFSEQAGQYFRVRDNDIGRPLADLVTHLDVNDLMEIVENVQNKRGHLTRRTRLVNGPTENLSLRVATYRLPSGRPGVFVAVSDLTDLIDLENEQQRFLRFLNQAPIALFAKDRDGAYWFKNRLAESISGPGLGMTDRDVFSAELAEKTEADDRRVRDRQLPGRSYDGVPIDGATRDFLTVKFPLEDHGIGGASIEVEHDGAADAIGRAQERFRAIARANSLAVILNMGKDAVDVDDRYRKLTGFEFDARFRSVHPDDRERTLEALDERQEIVPCRLHLADGAWRHVEFRCVDAGDELVTVVVDNHQAVDAAAKLTDELAHLQSQMERRTSTLQSNVSNLAERNADLDSFAHAAAHDLKAPLRAMMAFSELAAEAIGEEHAARSFLTRIEHSSARMAGMVDSLLQLASAGRDALAIRRCEVEPIVHQVRNDLSLEIEQAGAVFEIETLDPVLADPTALGVILTNLIANSVKYRSERTPRIRMSSSTEDGYVILTVTDNGIGFDQSKAVEIFEPFRRLHSRDQFEGSGVGLAICRRLASRLDGEIWATAHTDGGTAVSLKLPSPEVDS